VPEHEAVPDALSIMKTSALLVKLLGLVPELAPETVNHLAALVTSPPPLPK
jgi:hypothetical protein